MMTNKRYFLYAVLVIGLVAQVSCKKEFLEIVPKGQQIASTTKDYRQILNTNYLMQSTAGVYMGDEIIAFQPFFNEHRLRVQRLFKYADRIYEADGLPDELSDETGYIRKLYLFNKIINEVMDSKGGAETEKKAILAEAKAGRAVCNFMFLTDFSTPYNPATANSELGIPELTQADVTLTNFKRLTKKENYESIIKDLTAAIPDLGPLEHRRKISRLAAQFYLARIYMAMQNFTAAKQQLDDAFAEIPRANIPLALYDYNKVLDPDSPETWFPMLIGAFLIGTPLPAENTQTIYGIDVSAMSYVGGNANVFLMSPHTVSLFDPQDKRPNMYDSLEFNGAAVFPLGMKHPIGFITPVGPSLPDLYLMRAECRARDNDLAGAISDIEFLRAKRTGAPAVPAAAAANREALVRYILDERIREYTFTGLRWLDMRRLSVDPVYGNHVRYTHEVRSYVDTNNDGIPGDVVETYQLDPKRFALKFGERMLRESKGLEENP
ncbi:RagB/SusD family nutrient uptake outer membrane protein [Chitinophaga sedimenti]|uniref:RagB/SusD family nutrient uptake outer membrane protein n=1 Tax=Chitinophaga sedimenti TaxID=2033606 RepID=UPI0020050D4D|nr:RagB/SusD family nutrient uptake outer membrane protein [Chitinophaga sedimenti]MCK7556360.1 RagB/SusD family nutrient uptake outer membrane protein [Chitinophaga sedimenti]